MFTLFYSFSHSHRSSSSTVQGRMQNKKHSYTCSPPIAVDRASI